MRELLSFFGADLIHGDAFRGLILVVEEIALVLAFLAVFEGCRRLVRGGLLLRIALAVALGLAFSVAEGAIGVGAIDSFKQAQARQTAESRREGREPDGVREQAASSPEARSQMSQYAGAVGDVNVGNRIDVLDGNGVRARFVPTTEQQELRESVLREQQGKEDSAQSAYEHGIRLLIGAITCVLAGLYVGRHERRTA